ncbi:carboxypeptidase S [Phialemonium atrogriseum]|uniref:Carboxypeptidase S n=1 Tax=Phialemonium atrogriseum TaxID=1093897 RepID=A0AAJ0FJT6_9PEZI|nr:carboxypeptidase S [Phialemonium atrogriseum]KAK1763425.1 carboxypeptidase S [Phialemonium atrogriseum]
MEKSALPLAAEPLPSENSAPRSRRTACLLLVPLVLAGYLCAPFLAGPFPSSFIPGGDSKSFKNQCTQPDPLFPGESGNEALKRSYDYISTDDFRNATVKRLSGAVRVKSESFDDLGAIGEDSRWDVMYDFSAYLKTTFPLIHEKLRVEKVNTHGLLYTWEGSDDSLKPTLLMAHQDTVPVPPQTIPAWTYPPWSGKYDGKYIWGRGAADCKDQLIAVMEAVELLLEAKFEPKRTILLSFGFDEECSGRQGGGHLAPFIRKRYGDDGIAVIVDEGATFEKAWGTVFAKPGMAEKGKTDVHITVRMPGGHSSIPPDHTGIGVLSEIITLIEAEQYRTRLVDENPYYAQLKCGAEHSPDFPRKLKKLLSRRTRASSHRVCKAKPDRLALEAAKQGPDVKYLMQTSQAVDVISGGAKVNAIPERATVTVNHRINIGETPSTVWDRLTELVRPVAKRHNLTLHAFDGADEEPLSISLVASNTTLDTAPVTPADATPFEVVAGTTRALYGRETVVTPGIMTGNTDTRYYWDLTRHIFRFGPGFDPESDSSMGGGNIHTVDERASVAGHINSVRWFTLFVRNMDDADI